MTLIRRSYNSGYFDNALHRTYPNSTRNRRRIEMILKHQQSGRLLEIGPATGQFLDLASNWFDTEGIEISADAIKSASSDLRPKIRVGNIETTPLPARRYNVVAAFNILEHLHDPAAVVDKIGKSLTPDGCCVGTVPCNSGPVGRVYTQITNFFDRTHRSTLEPERWRQLFLNAGFTHIDLFGELPIGPRFCIHVRHPHWFQISPNMMFVCR